MEKEIIDTKEVRRRFHVEKHLILKEESDVRVIMNADLDNKELSESSDEREVLYEGTYSQLLRDENAVDKLRQWLDSLYLHWMDYKMLAMDILDIHDSLKSALEVLEITPDQKFVVIRMLPERPLRRSHLGDDLWLMEAWSYQHMQRLKNLVLSNEEYVYGDAVKTFPEKRIQKLMGDGYEDPYKAALEDLGNPRFVVLLKIS